MKLKIRFEVEVEYTPDKRNYPEGSRTPEAMLALDLASANEDPFLFLSSDTNWVITGDVLK